MFRVGAMEAPEALAIAINPPALPGLGNVGGWSLQLQDMSGHSDTELNDIVNAILAEARTRPELQGVRTTYKINAPSYQYEIDREKVKNLGVQLSDVFTALQVNFGGYEVNDFNQFGRTYHRELKEMHPVGAYAFDAYADVRLSADFAVGAIAHMVSGHDPLKPRTERFGQFDRLFGSGHNYFGYTDLFSITMQQANYQGMWHAGLVGRYRHKGLKLELTTSYLWLDRTAPRQQPGIGCEVSLVGAYKFAGCCQLEGGYVVLFPSATTRAMRAAEPVRQPAQFAYLSMLLTMTH